MKSEHQIEVERMMHLAGQRVPSQVTVPEEDVRRLRAALILEEALEVINAMGMEVFVYGDDGPMELEPKDIDDGQIYFVRTATIKVDPAKLAKECGDLSVVNTGTLSAFGIHDIGVLQAVDAGNLSKFSEGVPEKNELGKVSKGTSYRKPDMEMVLRNQKITGRRL